MNTFLVKRTSCPVCGNKNTKQVYSIPYKDEKISGYLEKFYSKQGFIDLKLLENETYSLSECDNCKLLYQEYAPNDDLLSILYDQWINPSMAFERSKTQSLDSRLLRVNEFKAIISYIRLPPEKIDFFDFGMGWGNSCRIAKALGINVFGTELSEHRKENAKSIGVNLISWDEILDYKFHYIAAEHVFEHLVEPLTVLKHLSQALSNQGVLHIAVPNRAVSIKALSKMDWSAARFTEYHLHTVSPLEHINSFLPSTLKILADKAGLKEIHIENNMFKHELLEKPLNALKNIYRKYTYGSTDLYFVRK